MAEAKKKSKDDSVEKLLQSGFETIVRAFEIKASQYSDKIKTLQNRSIDLSSKIDLLKQEIEMLKRENAYYKQQSKQMQDENHSLKKALDLAKTKILQTDRILSTNFPFTNEINFKDNKKNLKNLHGRYKTLGDIRKEILIDNNQNEDHKSNFLYSELTERGNNNFYEESKLNKTNTSRLFKTKSFDKLVTNCNAKNTPLTTYENNNAKIRGKLFSYSRKQLNDNCPLTDRINVPHSTKRSKNYNIINPKFNYYKKIDSHFLNKKDCLNEETEDNYNMNSNNNDLIKNNNDNILLLNLQNQNYTEQTNANDTQENDLETENKNDNEDDIYKLKLNKINDCSGIDSMSSKENEM